MAAALSLPAIVAAATTVMAPSAVASGAAEGAIRHAAVSGAVGSCLDLFAPGESITSAWNTDDTAAQTLSGTSMAAPHATAAAALVLAANPTATPQQVRDALVSNATPNKIAQAGANSPNLLLYAGSQSAPPVDTGCGPFTNSVDVALRPRTTVQSSITVAGCTGSASSRTAVEVHIKHPRRGDLSIDLVAPDGTVFRLKRAAERDRAANLGATYTVNASRSPRNGTWQLRVRNDETTRVGYIDSWTLKF